MADCPRGQDKGNPALWMVAYAQTSLISFASRGKGNTRSKGNRRRLRAGYLDGYPIRQDGGILRARDCPLCPSGKKSFSLKPTHQGFCL